MLHGCFCILPFGKTKRMYVRLLSIASLLACSISLLSGQSNSTQGDAFAAFAPLLNHTWHANGNWGNGQAFKQEITFFSDLENSIIRAEAKGFTDKARTQWGKRNHGVRHWNPANQRMEFYEFDALGGLTTGYLSFRHDSIYYHYTYDGATLTDAWEPSDDGDYTFTVGVYTDTEWKEVYLSTKFSQENPTNEIDGIVLPYSEIPPTPTEFTATNVTARMIDGLGFRYYWATEGLREEDLVYRIGEDSRSSAETISHIYDLAEVVHHAVIGEPIMRPSTVSEFSFEEQRKVTLLRLKAASDHLRQSHSMEMNNMKLTFQRGDRSSSYPFWNNLNGPLADAIWHVGQVVMLRRASGNPFNSKVSVFRGILRE